MLRVHCVQIFYNLSDPAMEDLLYESNPVRRFVGLKLTGPLPDKTTTLNFHHLIEVHAVLGHRCLLYRVRRCSSDKDDAVAALLLPSSSYITSLVKQRNDRIPLTPVHRRDERGGGLRR